MYALPLFPLDTVLFPSMPIHLHIFEHRYREMINHCIAHNQPFGVVLIHHGLEAGGALAVPHTVGVAAHITRVERLEDGRMNLTALGEERFRIHALSRAGAYLVGEVESVPMERPYSLAMQRSAHLLRPWVQRYLEQVTALDIENGLDLSELELPDDPLLLTFLSAMLLQLPPPEKQPLLEAPDALTLMHSVLRLYRRESTLLAHLQPAAQPELN